MSETPEIPQVENRARKPPGILPRHAQTWMVAGIALLMVVIIAFSGRTPSAKKTETPAALNAETTDPVQARIQEYRARIEEQARKLAAEQAQVAQARQVLSAQAALPPTGGASPYLGGPAPATSSIDDAGAAALARERAAINADKLKRQYESAFASNIAVSRRAEPAPRSSSDGVPAKQPPIRMFQILEGTVLETALTNRLDGSYAGPINCQVTADVYSHDREELLIPQGSRVLGEVRAVDSFDQKRLAVAFHRLILPNGYSVRLDRMPGLNQLGETGLVDRVNRHYVQVFGVSLAIGAIAGLNQATSRYGADASGVDVYRQGVTGSLAQSSLNILDRYLNVLPTFTIREGHRVKVYLTADLSLPAYDPAFRPTGPQEES